MSDVMDLMLLRQLVGGVITTLGDHYTHEKLGEACRRLGLPEPPGEDEGTERRRVQTSFAELPDGALPDVTERILTDGGPPEPDATTRNAIQDVLWAGQGTVEIPRKARREIARDLDLGDLALSPTAPRERDHDGRRKSRRPRTPGPAVATLVPA
jgi:hypothetical protein